MYADTRPPENSIGIMIKIKKKLRSLNSDLESAYAIGHISTRPRSVPATVMITELKNARRRYIPEANRYLYASSDNESGRKLYPRAVTLSWDENETIITRSTGRKTTKDKSANRTVTALFTLLEYALSSGFT